MIGSTLVILVACVTLAPDARVSARTPHVQDAAAAALVERAGAYVDAYVEAFSAIVCEERQVQKDVRADGRVKKVREIVSDFLLVKTGSPWLAAFRDVIAVDGKPVRNREDRLRKLFLDNPNRKAADLARAIAEESRRYNLGPVRNGNSPLLPIIFLTRRIASAATFTATGAGSLTFQEVRTPTVLATIENGRRRDLVSHGSFEIDPATGRVLAAELSTSRVNSRYAATFRVRYEIDPKLAISVPVEVTERYDRLDKPREDRTEVAATYMNFRRFQVSTAEQIK